MPPADEAIRLRHAQLAEDKGRPALHGKLAQIDPAASRRIHANDFVRVSRALEVFELTGRTQSAWHAEHGFAESRHDACLLGIDRTRESLDARITARTAAWLDGGWVEEVRRLLEAGYRHARAMEAVGYRQVRDHLDGQLAAADLHDTIVRATRTFVRRQRTWLRDQNVKWLPPPA
jgi:tRNA dimethylallyltransferase